jgi:hypothetical protein
MSTHNTNHVSTNGVHDAKPELTVIGSATDVINGLPGGGFEGAYSLTPPDFEFEPDDDQSA